MLRKSIAAAFKFGVVDFLLFAFLFAGGFSSASSHCISSTLTEITVILRDPGTQWMLVACLLVYFVTFTILERRAALSHPALYPRKFWNQWWLIAFVVLVLSNYALRYDSAAKSLQVLVLVSGIVAGKAAAVWVRGFGIRHLTPALLRSQCAAPHPAYSHLLPKAEKSLHPVDTERERIRRCFTVIGILLAMLAGAALVQPESSANYYYHGVRRWCGVWDNPNLFGLLMGVGTILGFGLFLNRRWQIEDGRWRSSQLLHLLSSTFYFLSAGFCGIGLFKSYSRGAWLGTAVGLGVLVYFFLKTNHINGRAALLRRPKSDKAAALPYPTPGAGVFPISNEPPFSTSDPSRAEDRRSALPTLNYQLSTIALLLSLAILSFWHLHSSESLVAQRIASVGNPNDFSWRNRVVAWQGAIQMMRDRPFTGFGWQQAEVTYAKEYCPPRVTESAAIQMNDYLTIGISCGVPALVCFLLYVWLSLRGVSSFEFRVSSGGARPPRALFFAPSRKTSEIPNALTSEPPEVGCEAQPTTPGAGVLPQPTSILQPPSSAPLAATCRAGAVVLLVGFWFDGGLFKLPVAVVFWTLL